MGFSCSDTAASAPPPGDKLRPMNGILIVAHAPLASALRACVLHVFPDSANAVSALDVMPNAPPEESLAQARILMRQLDTPQTLVLTDVFGATPCNVAHKLVDGVRSKLIAGVNLPMLLRTVSYRHESLDALVSRAMVGATQGVIQVAVTAPQNQARRTTHDQDHRDHQQ
jgi:mannose PTS system EIIA component